jgi:hypothetical protein
MAFALSTLVLELFVPHPRRLYWEPPTEAKNTVGITCLSYTEVKPRSDMARTGHEVPRPGDPQ